jgi:hypothetical protein
MPRFVGAFFQSQSKNQECPDESGHGSLKGCATEKGGTALMTPCPAGETIYYYRFAICFTGAE